MTQTPRWLPIRYRDFHDVPRTFVVEHDGDVFFFDSSFSEALDDYTPEYTVYKMNPDVRGSLGGSWHNLAAKGVRLGTVPTKSVAFDPTRRAAVRADVFSRLT